MVEKAEVGEELVPSEGPKGTLLILEGPDAGKGVPIAKLPFSIGRLPGNDLALVGDPQVSREHARVEAAPGGGMEIADLRSRNGVFVNQKRIDRVALRPGDQVRIGTSVMIFEGDPAQHPAREPPARRNRPSGAEEPTAIRNLSDPESSAPVSATTGLEEAAKLFRSTLPPQGLVAQILDIFFQGFAPDRAEVVWEAEERMEAARSRQHGKKCPSFPLSPELTKRGLAGPAAFRAVVPTVLGSGSEERSIVISPLRAYGEVKGWIYGDRSGEMRPYSSRDAQGLESFSALAGAALERSTILLDQRRLRERILLMEKHLSPEVSRMLASHQMSIEESMLSVEEREVTVLFSDIQGFTTLAERLSAPEIAALLNEYFQRMVDVINANHGMVNKFIGDAIMALFGAPKSHGNDAVNAVAAGLQMTEALQRFWTQIDEKKRFNIRIGINTGKVVAGNIGSEKKMEYTVLGDEVNLASRLEGISPPNVVTIGPRTAELVKERFRLERVSGVKVKGKSNVLEVFRVLGPNSGPC